MKFLIACLLIVSHMANAQKKPAIQALAKNDFEWIQKILDNWHHVCRDELKIKPNPLPWIIFYDSTAAWHLNPDKKMLPPFEKTSYRFLYNGQQYELFRIAEKMSFWVPDRPPVAMGSLPIAAMPYAGNKKSFFISPLPTLFHLLAPASEAASIDLIFLGTNMHEVTHTRQLPFVILKLLQVQKDYKLPESINDNTIENTFGKNDAYKELFFTEKTHLWNAVFAGNTDSCIAHIEAAFRVADKRTKEFFSGDSIGYDLMDEIFNSLEGAAMWAQYRITLKNLPQKLSQKEAVAWVVERAPAWSQEKGLALFLLIDRFDPDWKRQFFEKELPSASQYLRDIISRQKRK